MCTLYLFFLSLESGILNSTAVRGHDCHPEAVHHSKRIKLRMCMLYITCTGVLLMAIAWHRWVTPGPVNVDFLLGMYVN